MRGSGASQAGFEEVDEVGDRAGIFKSLHDDKKRGEEKQELPAYAAVDVFGFDAADDENERSDSGGGKREGEIQNPQDEDEDRGDDAFCEQAAVHGDGDRRSLVFRRGRVPELAPKQECENGDIEKKSEEGDGSEMHEEFEKSEMRGDADEGVLRIAGDGHDGADVGGSGESGEVRSAREAEAFGDGEYDGREHEADGVVDKKRGKNAGGENEKDEELEGSFGNGGDARGDPVEEAGDLEMRDENHDAEKKNDGVPADGGVGVGEGNDSGEDHGDGSAKCGGGSVEAAAASGFDGDEDVRDEEDNDGEPVQMRGKSEG